MRVGAPAACPDPGAGGGCGKDAATRGGRARPRLSRRLRENLRKSLSDDGGAAAQRVRDLWREAVRSRIALRRGGRTVLVLPAAVGVAGSLALPGLAAAAVIAALAMHTATTVERAATGA